ncbi:MAG: patatin-like phospholipase family protein [Clostridia bacterium]|nr:patatin-like phospholipase family protein [Clostridia bacterium]
MENKKALVLCGGGAKGGYHVGVWKALKEIGYEPDIITGTSVGALIGALLAIHEDEAAYEIWENMNMERVFEKKPDEDINSIKSMDEFVLKLGKLGGVDPKPLKELVRALGDEKKFRATNIEFGVVTTCLNPPQKIEKFVDEMEEGKVADYILASTACFPIMQRYNIDGKDYVDGGYTDNVPFDMALRRGATELVIVDMHGMNHISKPDDVQAKIHYISPKHDLGNFILFNKEQSIKNIEMGYLDTMKLFGKFEGNYYTFHLGTVKESLQYNNTCKAIYKRVFTDLPKVSPIEKLATKSFTKYIHNFNTEIFTASSNVMDILETAASIYEVAENKIYSLSSLLEEVKKVYDKSVIEGGYKKILSWNAIKSSITSLTEIKKVIKSYDKNDLTAFIVYLLSMPQLTMLQKNQILGITAIAPECLCAAICILALN